MFSLSSKQNNINKGNKKAVSANVDDEWSSFISNHYQDDVSDDDIDIGVEIDDDDVSNLTLKGAKNKDNSNSNTKKLYDNANAPTPSDIYISTKSKIAA